MKITVLTDNPNSWFVEYGKTLVSLLKLKGHQVEYIFDKNNIKAGDILFMLSCSNIVEQKLLELNKNNIVVHASDLPKGKGFAPLQWQILNGKNDITITLFEAVKEVDAGPYYIKKIIQYNGTELYEELRHTLSDKIIELCVEFVDNYKTLKPVKQTGNESFYPRRKDKDDEIDPQKTIIELFNHFRIADNNRFPLYFYHKGNKYYIKVEKDYKSITKH